MPTLADLLPGLEPGQCCFRKDSRSEYRVVVKSPSTVLLECFCLCGEEGGATEVEMRDVLPGGFLARNVPEPWGCLDWRIG